MTRDGRPVALAEREGGFLMPLADAFELARFVNQARYGNALATRS